MMGKFTQACIEICKTRKEGLHFCFLSFSRSTEFSIELNRFMERFYVESRAIDVESLCIVAGEKVCILQNINLSLILVLVLLIPNYTVSCYTYC